MFLDYKIIEQRPLFVSRIQSLMMWLVIVLYYLRHCQFRGIYLLPIMVHGLAFLPQLLSLLNCGEDIIIQTLEINLLPR